MGTVWDDRESVYLPNCLRYPSLRFLHSFPAIQCRKSAEGDHQASCHSGTGPPQATRTWKEALCSSKAAILSFRKRTLGY